MQCIPDGPMPGFRWSSVQLSFSFKMRLPSRQRLTKSNSFHSMLLNSQVVPYGNSGHTSDCHSFLMMARQICIAPLPMAGVLYVSGLTSSSFHPAFSCSYRACTCDAWCAMTCADDRGAAISLFGLLYPLPHHHILQQHHDYHAQDRVLCQVGRRQGA